MNETGTLVICPICQKAEKKSVLGRLLETGDFLVLRFHHGTTIISSHEFSIACGCGHSIQVAHGTIVSSHATI